MPRLPRPCLMLVTDRRLCHGISLPEAARLAVEAGVSAVQFRERDLPAGEQLELAAQVKRSIGSRALFIVNDRVDVALALGADGVQLPESGLPVAEARRLLGPDALIGRSVHSLQGAIAAERAGADYLIFGPVYATRTHPGAPPAGRQALREVAQAVSIPVLAIGGVAAEQVREVLQAGAAGAAVVSAILGTFDPKAAAAALVAKLT
ncbi:MAG: thiamine phosphate synthase [Chloroflexi bacterium]|nr:thiamine phosphate synthase [Chloroflexota bacterium]